MTASKSELWDQTAKAIKILDEIFKFAGQNATNFLGLLDTLTQSYEGEHIGTTSSQMNSLRSTLNSMCGISSPTSAILIELARVGYNSIATDASVALDDIAKGMIAASETVKNRAWTYGSISAAVGNVGNGTIYRLTTDKYGNTIETGAFPGGVVKAELINDKNTGRPSGTEQAKISGSGVIPTDYMNLGTCPASSLILTAYRAIDGFLIGGDFSDAASDGSNVAATGWTFAYSTVTTKLAIDTNKYYRKLSTGADGVTLKFMDNNTATQYLSALTSIIDTAKPCFLILRYYRYSSCDGTLTLRLGSKTTTVTLTSVADTTWLDLVIGVSNSDGWYDNFKEDYTGYGARIEITLASRTTGELGIGEIILAQPALYDGKYYLMTAGENNKDHQKDFLQGDSFTFTDSVSNTGRIQTTLARLYGKHLPHTSGTPTYADA